MPQLEFELAEEGELSEAGLIASITEAVKRIKLNLSRESDLRFEKMDDNIGVVTTTNEWDFLTLGEVIGERYRDGEILRGSGD